MHKNNIIKLLGIQEKLVKNIQKDENCINLFLETKAKIHICPSCGESTKHVHDYRTQNIQHIQVGKLTSYLFLKKEGTSVIIVVKNFTNLMISCKNILGKVI